MSSRVDSDRERESGEDLKAGLPLATTAINVLELYRGAFLPASAEENLQEVEAIMQTLIELPITTETYRVFGTLAAELRENGRPTGDFDEVIATITLTDDGEIATRDRRFARFPGLRVRAYQKSAGWAGPERTARASLRHAATQRTPRRPEKMKGQNPRA